MLHYWLEFEESIGKAWDKYLNKKVYKFHEDKRVYFLDISKSLNLFHHLLGGDKGKNLQVTDKRYLNVSRTLLQKISFLGKEFFLTWQDEESIYLPASFAYFDTKEQNEMLYYWLIAMATRVNVNNENLMSQNTKAVSYLVNKYSGFETFYNKATIYLSQEFEQLSSIKSLEEKEGLTEDYPNPMWIYPSASSAKNEKSKDNEEENLQREEDKDKVDTLEMKKEANELDDKHETDGFLAFLELP